MLSSSPAAYTLALNALTAFVHGCKYGFKVRGSHSVVLQAVWGKGSVADMAVKVRDATLQHGLNLGKAALIFKVGTALLGLASGGGPGTGEANKWHRALMAGIAGFVVWGESNPVNVQVNMYVMSRTAMALMVLFVERRMAAAKATPLSGAERAMYGPLGYRVFCTGIWAIALYLFFNHRHVLQSGLKASMQSIYADGDKYDGNLMRLVKGEVRNVGTAEVADIPASPTLPVEGGVE